MNSTTALQTACTQADRNSLACMFASSFELPVRATPLFSSSGSEWLDVLAQRTADVQWLYEPSAGRFVHVNSAYEREWLQPAPPLKRVNQWFDGVHPDDAAALRAAFDGMRDGAGYVIEYRRLCGPGDERWISEETVAVPRGPRQDVRFAGLSRDITQRKTYELAAARQEYLRSKLLATLAHELRGPLQPIISSAQLLARQRTDASEAERKAVAVIQRQAAQLSQLVEGMLETARMSHGKIRLQTAAIDLNDVLSAAIEANLSQIEQKRLNLTVRLAPSTLTMQGDPVRLVQMWSNLVHNATKFSHVGGNLDVGFVCEEAGMVTISVRDEGVGIAAADIACVFEPFRQATAALDHAAGGLGIGLSIVRSVAELHAGTVEVRSGGTGQGCEFIVTLPTTTAAHG